MKNLISLMVLMLVLQACGKCDDKGGVSLPVDQEQLDINGLLDDENAYRATTAQAPLTQGLSCVLTTFTAGDRIQASIVNHNTLSGLVNVATFLHKGDFNQPDSSINDGLNVLPLSLRNVYKNMYLLRCQGVIVVTQSNTYGFELTSDDASVLYLDGTKVIDNDNNHGTTLVAGYKVMRRGVHTFRLDYAQAGGGSQSLMLTSNGVTVPAKYLAH